MSLDPKVVAELTVALEVNSHLRVLRKKFASTPLGMGYGETRFASIDRSFRLVYIASTLKTGIAETIIRDKFEDRLDRTLLTNEVGDWFACEVSTKSALTMIDLRASGLLKLGVTTDATHAKRQDDGRRLSQNLYHNFNIDGLLYSSRLTGEDCLAIYDRAIAKLKAGKAVNVSRLPTFLPALTSLNVTVLSREA
ncbi:MAG TPA: RES family NAD+ phosphorylase [Nordella sp.]|nr:RES family NAD+ phosphorylase [Nordella sp.]